MKFGLKLVHSGPGASPDLIRRWARFAEDLGFHLLMTADHVALTPEVRQQYPAPYYEAFTTLAWLAAQTERILLGTTVIVVPYRHPVQTAQLCANLDQLCGGRFVFGVGVGWARSEFEALGVPLHKRGAITDDYLAAMKVLWTHDSASYEGRFVSFRDVELSPKPVQASHPPIWVGGDSDAAIRRAARLGDAWHPIAVRTDHLRDRGLPALRRVAEEHGRPTPALCPRILCNLTDTAVPEEQRLAGEGTLDQVRRDLLALEEMGAEYVLLDTKRHSPTETSPRHHESAWPMVAALAEKVLDIENETVR